MGCASRAWRTPPTSHRLRSFSFPMHSRDLTGQITILAYGSRWYVHTMFRECRRPHCEKVTRSRWSNHRIIAREPMAYAYCVRGTLPSSQWLNHNTLTRKPMVYACRVWRIPPWNITALAGGIRSPKLASSPSGEISTSKCERHRHMHTVYMLCLEMSPALLQR